MNTQHGRRVQVLAGPPIICPNPHCGYRGPSRRIRQGSLAVLAVLLLFCLASAAICYWEASADIRHLSRESRRLIWEHRQSLPIDSAKLATIQWTIAFGLLPAILYFIIGCRVKTHCADCGLMVNVLPLRARAP